MKITGERRTEEVSDALTGEEEAIGGGELLDGDQLHQDGRGQAVVGGDAEAIGGGERQDAGVRGDEGDGGGDEAADDHAGAVQGDGGHPRLVTEPTNPDLTNGVQDTLISLYNQF